MTNRAIACVASLATLLAVTTLLASDTPGWKQLQRGIELVEGKGDFAQAARLFDEISRSSDRALAARALFLLAALQERQGKDQARATYRRIVKEFDGQPIAAEARRRLIELEGPPPPRTTGMRRVLSGNDADPYAHITPDGRFLARADSGDVVVRNLWTNQVKRLMVVTDTPDPTSPERASRPMVSPDGTRIVYVWVSRGAQGGVRYQLRLMRNQVGSPSSELVDDSRFTSFDPIGWSPDGSDVFVTAWVRDDTIQLLRASVSNRDVKPVVLESFNSRLGPTSRPRLSPDGKYIAYSAVPPEALAPNATTQDRQTVLNQGPQHIYIRPTDASGRATEIIRGKNINESPIWMPDSKQILFVSNRSGDGFGLWQVGVEGGKVAGLESYVQAYLGRIRPVAMTSHGTLFYLPYVPGGVRAVDVFHAELDPETGRIRGERRRLVDSELDRSQAPSFSPDGGRVSFKKLIPNAGQPQQERLEVVVYSLSSGKVEFSYPLAGMDAGPTPWYDDGRHLLVRQINGSLLRLDLTTRRFRGIEQIANSRLPPECGSHVLSPDNTLYLSVLDPVPSGVTKQSHPNFRRTRRVVAFDLNTGEQKNVLQPQPIEMLSVLAVSPDGRMLAMAMRRDDWKTPRLVLMNTDGSDPPREVATGVVPRTASWTRAGLLVAREGTERVEIVRVSVHDGTFKPVDINLAPGGQFFDVSPDGTHVVYSDRSRDGAPQLWAYDNLWSHLKSER
jgi:Tol biopolymer transport system component